MSKLIGLPDKATHGNAKSVNFTYGTQQESYYPGSPISIPTSEPGTSQVSFTVSAANLITLSGSGISDISWLHYPYVFVGGTTSGVSVTISYRVLINGVSVNTGTFASGTTTYWTASIFRNNAVGVFAGDVVEVRFWADSTGISITYQGMQIHPWGVTIGKKLNWADNVVIVVGNYWSLVGGVSPTKNGSGSITYFTGSYAGNRAIRLYYSNTHSFQSLKIDPLVNGFAPMSGGIGYPVSSFLIALNSSGANPYYSPFPVITSLSWTPVQL